MARKTIDVINRTFQLRTCDIEIDGKAPRPCLEYHIKRCLGPCVKGLCTPEQYQEAVRDVRLLLEGRNTELADTLEGAWMKRREKALRDGREVSRPAQDRYQAFRTTEDGHGPPIAMLTSLLTTARATTRLATFHDARRQT